MYLFFKSDYLFYVLYPLLPVDKLGIGQIHTTPQACDDLILNCLNKGSYSLSHSRGYKAVID